MFALYAKASLPRVCCYFASLWPIFGRLDPPPFFKAQILGLIFYKKNPWFFLTPQK